MAERPIFVPSPQGPSLVWKHDVSFQWYPGMSIKQSQKSIDSLHAAAREQLHVRKVLEISSKSKDPLGVKLSAFNLMIHTTRYHQTFSVECAYQSSKVFERGGPYKDIRDMTSREAKGDPRLRDSGPLIGFRFFEVDWELEPKTAFYDWLYINALHKQPELADYVLKHKAFSDIAFNPERSLNCQAFSAALYVALHEKDLLTPSILREKSSYLEALRGIRATLQEEASTTDQAKATDQNAQSAFIFE
jgi:hypothetical protein